MAEIPIRFVSLCHMFGVLIIAFGVESNKTSLTSILVPLGMGIMIPVSNLEEAFIIALFFFFPYISRWGHMLIVVFTWEGWKSLIGSQSY